MVARKIAASRRILCASPAYLKQHGSPESPADLAKHRLLSYSIPGRESWGFVQDGKRVDMRVSSRVTADQAELLLDLAREGMGIARLPEFLLMKDIAAGVVVPLLTQYSAREPIYAIVRTRRNVSQRLRVFIDFVEEKLRGAAWNLDARPVAK